MTTPGLAGPRAVADLTDGLVLASVEIAATPERVFTALASEEIAQWWRSPDAYRVTRWVGDVRPGGRWRSEGTSADGSTFAVGGEYLEVDPPRLLVHTWSYEGRPGPVTTVRIRLEPVTGGTRVTVRHSGFTDATQCDGHARGWERVLGWLGNWVAPAR
ncbi:MAG TPA: SRPBCC domain-containing protein [Gemmatimonadaceae bacterium]|nr:SRPBCC domain-containing protein [Gemmatimonadaceae bacterium]